MSRRAQIAMSAAEVAELLERRRVVICATNGPRGFPHLMPLWYVVRQGELWAWTYAKSQKVRNLERDPRATLQLEEGVQYGELRGVMLEVATVLHRDRATVAGVGLELLQRYAPAPGEDAPAEADPAAREAILAQAAKRVALQFRPQRTASWDHGKLGGTY